MRCIIITLETGDSCRPMIHAHKHTQGLDGYGLVNEYRRFFSHQPDWLVLHQAHKMEEPLKILSYQALEYPTLAPLLNTLYDRSLKDFDRALFCGWFSALLAGRLGCDIVERRELFLAGLYQDLGRHSFTHLAPTIPEFQLYRDEEKVHPLIATKILEVVNSFPERSRQHIAAHHERADGTGYPRGLMEANLDLGTKILIVSNQVFDWTQIRFEGRYRLSQILPLIRHHSVLGFNEVYREVVLLLKELPESHSPLPMITSDDISWLLDQQNRLSLLWSRMLQATGEIAVLESHKACIPLKNLSRQAWLLVNSTGVLSDVVKNWLRDLQVMLDDDGVPTLISEYQEVKLLLFELAEIMEQFRAQLSRFMRSRPDYLSPEQIKLFAECIDQMWAIDDPVVELDEYTLFSL